MPIWRLGESGGIAYAGDRVHEPGVVGPQDRAVRSDNLLEVRSLDEGLDAIVNLDLVGLICFRCDNY